MKPSTRVLVVDDEPDVVANWTRVLQRDGYACITATDGERAVGLLEAERPDLVLTDLRMLGVDGMAILARALELDPDVVVIMITGHGTVQSAVEAMRAATSLRPPRRPVWIGRPSTACWRSTTSRADAGRRPETWSP